MTYIAYLLSAVLLIFTIVTLSKGKKKAIEYFRLNPQRQSSEQKDAKDLWRDLLKMILFLVATIALNVSIVFMAAELAKTVFIIAELAAVAGFIRLAKFYVIAKTGAV